MMAGHMGTGQLEEVKAQFGFDSKTMPVNPCMAWGIEAPCVRHGTQKTTPRATLDEI